MADDPVQATTPTMPLYIPFHEQTLDQLRTELDHWQRRPGRPGRERYIRVCREWIARREQEATNAR